jgi:hypothetical protein
MEQKNLDDQSMDVNTSIGVFPKKIRKTRDRRVIKNKLIKIEKVTNCKNCNKPILPPFGGALCGDCMREWDVQTYAQILARDKYGKAIKCEKCGLVTKKGMEWHHWDYSKPLEVIGLCKRCHGMARRLGKEKFEETLVVNRMRSLTSVI